MMFAENTYGQFNEAMEKLRVIEGRDDRIQHREVWGVEREKHANWFKELRKLAGDVGSPWPPSYGLVCIFYYNRFWRYTSESFLPDIEGDVRRYMAGNSDLPPLVNEGAKWDLSTWPDDIAQQVFLFAVNAGQTQCVREIQRAASDPGKGWKRGRLEIDGIYGPATIAALRDKDPKEFYQTFTAHCEGFYRLLEAVRVERRKHESGSDLFPADVIIQNRLYDRMFKG